jgi:hypothetical protein
MPIARTIAHCAALSLSLPLAPPLPAQQPGARAEVEALNRSIALPLLAIPDLGVDVRRFVEETKKGQTFYWIANKGQRPIHFFPVWVMQDGKPFQAPDGEPLAALHLSPGGRMRLVPPKGFKEIQLEEVRVGDDSGPALEKGLVERSTGGLR